MHWIFRIHFEIRAKHDGHYDIIVSLIALPPVINNRTFFTLNNIL